MNVNDLTDKPAPAQPASVMLVNFSKGTVAPTEWIQDLEAEALARAEKVTQVTNAEENRLACEAQATLARYLRAVQAAEDRAKKPLNTLKAKILAMSHELQEQAEIAGNRLGQLCADFQKLENDRVGAIRRLQDQQASALEQERDKRLAQAKTTAETDQIKTEYHEQVEALDETMPEPAPARANGQVIKKDWNITVTDPWLLARAMPACVKIEPRFSEIKDLLNAGVKVPGIIAEEKIVASVRLQKELPAINI